MTSDPVDDLPRLTTELALAYASGHAVAPADLPALLSGIHKALASLGKAAAPEPEPQQPAVPIRSSVKPDYLICLEDGQKLKMLKRYLRAHHGMTPEQYRAKWKLPADYPMVAPAYAATRRAIAQQMGLGRKAAAPKPVAPKPTVAKPVASKPAVPVSQAAPKLVVAEPVAPRPAAPVSQAAPKLVVAKPVASKPAVPVSQAAPKLVVAEPVASRPAAPVSQAASKPAVAKLVVSKPSISIAQAAPAPISAPPPPSASAPPAKRKLLRPLFLRDSDPVRPQGEAAASASAATGAREFGHALDLLRQAIGRHRCVRTSYNKRTVTLAPHIVFTRHDELYLRAVTVEQDGRRPREWKLGTFKLAGLGPVTPSATPFVRFADYEAEAGQIRDIVCALPRT